MVLRFLPEGGYEKYARIIIGVMVLSQLALPLLSLGGFDAESVFSEALTEYEQEMQRIETQVEQAGLNALYRRLAEKAGLPRALEGELPQGVVAVDRDGLVFLQNFSGEAQRVNLQHPYEELLSGETLSGEKEMPVCGVWVLRPRT